MKKLVSDIKNILQIARQETYQAINHSMVKAYWLLGQRIVEEEQEGNDKAIYGDFLLKNLSKELTAEFGRGFSSANLKNFRKFYLTYIDFEKSYTLCSQLSWSHNRLIMRVTSEVAREFYLKEAKLSQWSVRETERQIKSQYYERLLSTQKDIIETNAPQKLEDRKYDFIKDPYVFEFLNIPQNKNDNEKKLETLLLDDLQQFFLELGKGFSFVGRQFRISTETTHFYIDLVFYNYILKCFVLFDLKITKLSHQDIGQMDMYIRMFDDIKKGIDDNPTIGIILCADKDETMIKYSILDGHEQLFASKYLTYLPTEEELANEIDYVKRLNNG
jgi:predicted nuclease of restriction endonuclease-like (RecB) superfamily